MADKVEYRWEAFQCPKLDRVVSVKMIIVSRDDSRGGHFEVKKIQKCNDMLQCGVAIEASGSMSVNMGKCVHPSRQQK